MYVVGVTVFVKPEKIKDFKEVTLENARNTRKETSNVRFDVLQTENDLSNFFLYEVYKSVEGFQNHQKTEHYLKSFYRFVDLVQEELRKIIFRLQDIEA